MDSDGPGVFNEAIWQRRVLGGAGELLGVVLGDGDEGQRAEREVAIVRDDLVARLDLHGAFPPGHHGPGPGPSGLALESDALAGRQVVRRADDPDVQGTHWKR